MRKQCLKNLFIFLNVLICISLLFKTVNSNVVKLLSTERETTTAEKTTTKPTDPPPPEIPISDDEFERKVRDSFRKGKTDPQYRSYVSKCSRPDYPGRVQYFDDTPFLIREPSICKGQLYLLVAIHSRPQNFERRATIRATWGSLRQIGPHRIGLAFFLGNPGNSRTLDSLKQESSNYRDIVLRDYQESYRNLTRKHLSIMEWTAENCKQTQYLMKADDDTFVNIFHVIRLLEETSVDGFFCTAVRQAKVYRRRSKWAVTREEFKENSYPTYCMGFGYLASIEVVKQIYWCSMFTKFFWIDDVYVTGVLAEQLGIPRRQFYEGHTYSYIRPSVASQQIVDYLFLIARRNEFMPYVWEKLWTASIKYFVEV